MTIPTHLVVMDKLYAGYDTYHIVCNIWHFAI